MRRILSLILALACAACAAASPDGGVANYDTLNKAQSECAAKGGELILKPGGDTAVLTDYACKRK